MPTTDCIPQLRLDFHPEQPVDVTFDGPQLSSDGGLLLLRQVDDQLGLAARVAAVLRDDRDPVLLARTSALSRVLVGAPWGTPQRGSGWRCLTALVASLDPHAGVV